MDKELKPVMQWMMSHSIRPVVYKTLAGFLMFELTSLADKINNFRAYTKKEEKLIKFNEVINSEDFRDHLVSTLTRLIPGKIEIIQEIMTQYSLTEGRDITDLYDMLSVIFDEEFVKVRDISMHGDLRKLYLEHLEAPK